jgi:hypothetical protein
VAYYFLSSDEIYLTAIHEEYVNLLDREEDQPGLQAWFKYLKSAQPTPTPGSLAVFFLASQEYQEQAQREPCP